MAYSFKTFEMKDLQNLYGTFVESFSGNSVTFRPSTAQFERRILHKLKISPEISSLMLHGSDIVGFVLHTLGNYENKLTAYNGGTGLMPEHRGYKRSYLFYERLIPTIQASGASRILLEVISTNDAAIRLYDSVGFTKRKVVKGFKLNDQMEDNSPDVVLKAVKAYDLKFETYWDYSPTFLDSTTQLKNNIENEVILEAYINKLSVGYVIFQPAIGRISQFGVAPQWRNQGIGSALIYGVQTRSYQKKLTIMNVPESQTDTIEALMALGFENEVDQFEMELIL